MEKEIELSVISKLNKEIAEFCEISNYLRPNVIMMNPQTWQDIVIDIAYRKVNIEDTIQTDIRTPMELLKGVRKENMYNDIRVIRTSDLEYGEFLIY
jgi:hypothetical protein